MTKQEILDALWYTEREITVDGETLTVLTPRATGDIVITGLDEITQNIAYVNEIDYTSGVRAFDVDGSEIEFWYENPAPARVGRHEVLYFAEGKSGDGLCEPRIVNVVNDANVTEEPIPVVITKKGGK